MEDRQRAGWTEGRKGRRGEEGGGGVLNGGDGRGGTSEEMTRRRPAQSRPPRLPTVFLRWR